MACCVALEYKDGSKYCGESEKGILHGCGVFVESSNRGVYEGLWVNGGQHRGVFSWPNGKHYSGDWKGPVRIGLGVEKRPDGTKYSGEFSQNVMGPLGVLSLPTHGLYMGMWDSSGLQEGRGVEAYADGGKLGCLPKASCSKLPWCQWWQKNGLQGTACAARVDLAMTLYNTCACMHRY